jgi:hypothetical protein
MVVLGDLCSSIAYVYTYSRSPGAPRPAAAGLATLLLLPPCPCHSSCIYVLLPVLRPHQQSFNMVDLATHRLKRSKAIQGHPRPSAVSFIPPAAGVLTPCVTLRLPVPGRVLLLGQ